MECLHPALLYSEALFVSPLTAEGPTSKAVNLSRSWLKKSEVVLSSSKVRSCKSQSEQNAPWKGRTVVDWWRTCTQVLYQSAKWHTCTLYFSISICSSTIFHMETCFLLHYIYLTPIITFCIKKHDAVLYNQCIRQFTKSLKWAPHWWTTLKCFYL